jgi:hypothetical protein
MFFDNLFLFTTFDLALFPPNWVKNPVFDFEKLFFPPIEYGWMKIRLIIDAWNRNPAKQMLFQKIPRPYNTRRCMLSLEVQVVWIKSDAGFSGPYMV